MNIIRILIFIVFVLPKFIVWPLIIVYRYSRKKKGIKDDIFSRYSSYLRCLFMQKTNGRGYLELLKSDMTEQYAAIEEHLYSLLTEEYFKSTLQLVEEFRAEYPRDWDYILSIGQKTFGGSCTSVLSPSIFLAQLLERFNEQKRALKENVQGEMKWKLKMN